MFSLYFLCAMTLIVHAIDPIPINNCTLVVENEEDFDEDIIDYISEKSTVEIIQYNLDFSSLGPAFNLTNRTNPLAAEPDKWYRIKDKKMSKILLVYNKVLFLTFLSSVYEEKYIHLNATPFGCIYNLSNSEVEKSIRNFLLKDFEIAKKSFRTSIHVSETAAICTAHRTNNTNKIYWCCKYNLHGKIECDDIKEDVDFDIATIFVIAVILIVYLYSPLLIPKTHNSSITIYDNNVINIEGDLKIDNESKNLIIGKTKIQIDKIKEMKKFQTVYKSLKESDFRTYSNFAIVIKKRIGPFIIEGQPVITGFLSLTKFALGCEKHSGVSKNQLFYHLFLFCFFIFTIPSFFAILISDNIKTLLTALISTMLIHFFFITGALINSFKYNKNIFNTFRKERNIKKKKLFRCLKSFNLKKIIRRKTYVRYAFIYDIMYVNPITSKVVQSILGILYLIAIIICTCYSIIFFSPLIVIYKNVTSLRLCLSPRHKCVKCAINFILFLYGLGIAFAIVACYKEMVFVIVFLFMFPTPLLHSLISAVSAFILYLYALLATFRKKHDVCLKSIVEKKTLPENCKFCIEAKIKMDDPSQSQSSGVTELPIITFDLKMNDTELEFQESNGSIYLKIKKCILYMMKDGKVCVDKNVLVHFMSHTYMKIVEEVLIILLFIVTVVLVISFLGSNYYITVTNQMFITLVFSLLPSLVKLVKENKLKDNKLNEIDLEHEMQNSFQENFNSYSFDVVVEDILISTNEDTTGSTNDRRNSQIHAINNQRTDLNINSETTYLLSS